MTSDNLMPLTDEEKKDLQGQGTRALMSLLLFMGLLVVIVILSPMIYSIALLYGLLWILFGIAVVTRVLSSLNKFLALKRDLSGGQKRIIIGPVEAQDINVSRSSSRGRGIKVEGPASYNYWIKLQGLELSVSEEEYYQFKKDDLAEVHIAPHSKSKLRINPIPGQQSTSNEAVINTP